MAAQLLSNFCTPSARALTSLSCHGTFCLARITNTAHCQEATKSTRANAAHPMYRRTGTQRTSHLFTPVAQAHEPEHTSRTLVRVVVKCLDLRLRPWQGLRHACRLRTSSGTTPLCAAATPPASRHDVALRTRRFPVDLTWACLARLAACSSASQRGPRLGHRLWLRRRGASLRS